MCGGLRKAVHLILAVPHVVGYSVECGQVSQDKVQSRAGSDQVGLQGCVELCSWPLQ